MNAGLGASRARHSLGRFGVLLKVQAVLALREPYGLVTIGLPLVLLILFGYIGRQNPGTVGNSGLTIIDLWIPTIMVIGFSTIVTALPNTLVRDREIGWLRRVSTTPAHPSRLLGAQLVLLLVPAVAEVVIVLLLGKLIFGATLKVGPYFVLSTALSIVEIFSLGLLVAALVPSQTFASATGGVVFFLLMFLSGLWIQPAQVGDPLKTVMTYSPAGAAARALLDSVFNGAPSLTTSLTMVGYTVAFAFLAIRFFRWE